MSSDRVIVDAIKVAQDLVRQNLPQTHNLTDAATVMQFRELVRSQATRSALERSNDTVERVFAINRALIAFGVCAAIAGDHYSALGHRQRCAGIGDPNMPHLFAKHEVVRCSGDVAPASGNTGTEIALAA